MNMCQGNSIARMSLLLALLSAGCGYHMAGTPDSDPNYQWHTLYRDDVKTVAVPTFSNKTYYHGVEQDLTKAIVNQLEAFTPYKVASRDHADTILEGDIVRIRTRTISRDRVSAVPQEQMYVLIVNFHWRDLRTGKILVQRRDFEQTVFYYPTLGEDQAIGEEQNVQRLAAAIVQELQADWGKDPNEKKVSESGGER